MMSRAMCADTEVHEFHNHKAPVRMHCAGETDCGVKIHEPHFFEVVRDLWCQGICGCNGKKDHGPGEHK